MLHAPVRWAESWPQLPHTSIDLAIEVTTLGFGHPYIPTFGPSKPLFAACVSQREHTMPNNSVRVWELSLPFFFERKAVSRFVSNDHGSGSCSGCPTFGASDCSLSGLNHPCDAGASGGNF